MCIISFNITFQITSIIYDFVGIYFFGFNWAKWGIFQDQFVCKLFKVHVWPEVKIRSDFLWLISQAQLKNAVWGVALMHGSWTAIHDRVVVNSLCNSLLLWGHVSKTLVCSEGGIFSCKYRVIPGISPCLVCIWTSHQPTCNLS